MRSPTYSHGGARAPGARRVPSRGRQGSCGPDAPSPGVLQWRKANTLRRNAIQHCKSLTPYAAPLTFSVLRHTSLYIELTCSASLSSLYCVVGGGDMVVVVDVATGLKARFCSSRC